MGSSWLMPAMAMALLLLSPVEPRVVSLALSGGRRYDAIFSFGDSFTDTGNNPVVFDCSKPGPAVGAAVPVAQGELPAGRQLRRRRRHRTRLQLLPRRRPSGRQPVPSQLQPSRAAELVRFTQALTLQLNPRMQGFLRQIALLRRRIRHQRLPLLLREEEHARNQIVRPGHHPYHLHGRRETDWRRGDHAVGSGHDPSGCSPPVLVTFADADAAEYDASTGCLKEPNKIVTLHNSLLLDAVEELREKHPDVTIVHTDLFRHVSEMVQNPEKFGFRKDVLSVCCGGPGRYHYNTEIFCGDEGATTCVDPSKSLFWDGVHLPEAAYHYIADDWLRAITYIFCKS